MSQRDSGYTRIERDAYETPEWVTAALVPHLPRRRMLHEPACGSGRMAAELSRHGFVVTCNDISTGADFLLMPERWDAIVTNPPYDLAGEFIEHALRVTMPTGFVCMLLRTDFDHAKTRQDLFGRCPQFAKKLVLTKRIVWIEPATSSPSFNHAWFIWDWLHTGSPILAYH